MEDVLLERTEDREALEHVFGSMYELWRLRFCRWLAWELVVS